MAWLRKLFRRESEPRADYYEEGLELLRAEKYHDALTSLRLALRESPDDAAVLQQIAIAYTRIGMTDFAVKTYRDVLDRAPDAVGAHYGIAFLLLQEDKQEEAVEHLRRFLASPPEGAEAARHVTHARNTLAELTNATVGEDPS